MSIGFVVGVLLALCATAQDIYPNRLQQAPYASTAMVNALRISVDRDAGNAGSGNWAQH